MRRLLLLVQAILRRLVYLTGPRTVGHPKLVDPRLGLEACTAPEGWESRYLDGIGLILHFPPGFTVIEIPLREIVESYATPLVEVPFLLICVLPEAAAQAGCPLQAAQHAAHAHGDPESFYLSGGRIRQIAHYTLRSGGALYWSWAGGWLSGSAAPWTGIGTFTQLISHLYDDPHGDECDCWRLDEHDRAIEGTAAP